MRRIIVILGLAVGIGMGAIALSGAPAGAESCLPAGGAELPEHEDVPDGDFLVLGRGWGHGVGMSQHGAQGAARLGCTHAQILETYYPGVRVGSASAEPDRLRVSLFPSTPGGGHAETIRVLAREGSIGWRLGDRDPVTQPQGDWWVVRFQSSTGSYLVIDEAAAADDDDDGVVLEGESGERLLRVEMDGPGKMIELSSKGRRYAHGALEFDSDGQKMYVRIAINSRGDDKAVDRYLWGLAEMPSSWPDAALESQAITGRSYALTRWKQFNGNRAGCRCDLYDSTSDQVYAGYEKEGEGQFGPKWVSAVNRTAGRVMLYEGDIATGFYSSTHGGHSETNAFSSFFGGSPVPYLQPVDDSRWEVNSSSDGNGVLRWAEAFSAERIGQAFDVGVAREVNLPEARGAGGRVGNPDRTNPDGQSYGGVEIIGTNGDRTVVSGLQFVQRLGVHRRSELFDVVRGDGAPAPGEQCVPTEDQTGNTTVLRTGGRDRVETAVAVSQAEWDTADDVVLATSISFPDALAAGALAARLDAPLLLTPGSGLATIVHDEIARLDAQRVHLMGGPAALSDEVENELVAAGYDTIRVAGETRFETAAQAALAAGPSESGDVAVALGDDWPDAVSAGALAASPDRVPTLLSLHGRAPDETLEALETLQAERVLLIGGPAALAEEVADELRDAGYEVERLAGATRYETSVAVSEAAIDRGGNGERTVVLATGQAFPDALSAGALTARVDGTLVLTPRCDLTSAPPVHSYLGGGTFDEGVIVGGVAAVSDLVREQATTAVNGE